MGENLEYITMREHVRLYTPKSWREHLQLVVYVPYWSEIEYNRFKSGDMDGLEWYFVEAIKDFFEVKKIKMQCEVESKELQHLNCEYIKNKRR